MFNYFNMHRPDHANLRKSWLKLHFREIQRFRYRRAHINQSTLAVSYSDAVSFLYDWGIFIFIISFLMTPEQLSEALSVSFSSFFSLMVSLQAKPDLPSCIPVHKPHQSGRGICALLTPKGRVVFHDRSTRNG